MLSYQHAFHAGNHGDILKHYVLSYVLNSLNKKEKPYTFYDTHSASGIYDLYDNRLLKTAEAQKGILTLLKQKDIPIEMENYISLVKEYADKNLYPGSPEIERRLMREGDTLVLSELHPVEIVNLRNNMNKPLVHPQGGPSIKIHNRNGWEMIGALTPPSTKRGAVIIDPSYEESQDYLDAARTICEVNRKWSNGIILLWYPLLAHRENEIEAMCGTIIEGAKKTNPNTEICNLQLCAYSKDAVNLPRLYGSGMLVINSPYQLEENALKVIDYVRSVIEPQFQLAD